MCDLSREVKITQKRTAGGKKQVSSKVTWTFLKKKNKKPKIQTHKQKQRGQLMLQYRSQKFKVEKNSRGARASQLVNKELLPEHSMLLNFMLSDSNRGSCDLGGDTLEVSLLCTTNRVLCHQLLV